MLISGTIFAAAAAFLAPRVGRLIEPAFFLMNAGWAWLRAGRRRDGKPIGFLAFALPRSTIFTRSAFADLVIAFGPGLLGRIVTLPTLLTAFVMAAMAAPAMDAWLGPATPVTSFSWTGELILLALWIVLFDLGVFLAHLTMHRSKFLWEFHKVHHSADVLNPLTAFRQHPVELVFFDFVPNFIIALALVIFARWYQPGLFGYVLLGITADSWFRLIGLQHLRHSAVPFHYPAWLNRVLISPSAHQLHHSAAERHFGRNLGSILAIWDRVLGTYVEPVPGEQYEYGLMAGEEGTDEHSVPHLLVMPFVRAGRLLVSKVDGRPAPQDAALPR
ncbi:MAG: sterol desaturase family protein [Alphaproteobacteria bacterium]|nr:sterol desaturase family protein [Alphaproteobacteria bacterium]MBV9418820.1 sterol desaturase family protein [Alphaproteobacteria bacterium]MBV9540212.1 sterol desaturase family protein [Alphaproteobacteria bacterium]MBV9905425.1 sterol desaturase family protein [Alphaproteobacteria bacterium]